MGLLMFACNSYSIYTILSCSGFNVFPAMALSKTGTSALLNSK